MSTNLHNLKHGRLDTLFGSAFVTDGGLIFASLPGLVCLLAVAELVLRGRRVVLAFLLGHVGATLIVAVGLAVAIQWVGCETETALGQRRRDQLRRRCRVGRPDGCHTESLARRMDGLVDRDRGARCDGEQGLHVGRAHTGADAGRGAVVALRITRGLDANPTGIAGGRCLVRLPGHRWRIGSDRAGGWARRRGERTSSRTVWCRVAVSGTRRPSAPSAPKMYRPENDEYDRHQPPAGPLQDLDDPLMRHGQLTC